MINKPSIFNVRFICRDSCKVYDAQKMNEDKPPGQEYTTIRISREVYERLCELGRKGETFDGILRRILYQEPRRR
jgi:hypothetical protein